MISTPTSCKPADHHHRGHREEDHGARSYKIEVMEGNEKVGAVFLSLVLPIWTVLLPVTPEILADTAVQGWTVVNTGVVAQRIMET